MIKTECYYIQERLAPIWKRLLNLDTFSPDQNFFAMGGHSILAIELLNEIEEVFAVKLNMKDIVEAPNVNDLSEIILAYKKNVTLTSQSLDFSHGLYPLTVNQKQVWGLNALYPESITHNISTAIKINRNLDINLLTKTINTIVERHESLRTRFRVHNGIPHQEILPEYTYEFQFININEENLKDRLQEEMKYIFNLEEAPLMRIRFFKLSETEIVFFFLVHHIIWDGLSNTFFFHEFISIYRSLEKNAAIDVPEVRLSYKEHAVKEITYLKSEEYFEQKKSWDNMFSGKLPVLNIPTDYPRPARINNQSETVYFEISADILERLETYAQSKYLSLYNIFFAAYFVLLAKVSGDDDFIVGTPVHGRHSREVRKVLGYFINTLPVRTKLAAEKSFKDNLGLFLEALKHAFYNQNVPLDILLKNASVEKDPSRTPLFQTLFIYLDVTKELDVFKSESLEQVKLERYSVHTELDFYLYKSREKVEGVIEFRKDLYTQASMKKMGAEFVELLEAILEDEQVSLKDLGVASTITQEHFVEMDVRPYDDFKNQRPFYKVIEDMAQAFPNKVALKTAKGHVNYDELNRKANLVAQELLDKGVRPGDYVGVSTNRSEKLVIALLGTLKAGACYVPLDPKFPDERLHYMLDRSGAKILICENNLLPRYPQFSNPIILEDLLSKKSVEKFSSIDVALDSSCYVLFTSGSTGKPKGVEVGHKNVLNFLISMSKRPGLLSDDKFLSVTTVSFDISVLELFLPLMTGATVYLANEDQVVNGEELASIIVNENITCMQATPTTWRLLLSSGWQGSAGLKILCGGEAMPKDLAHKLLPISKEVWNMYGPTETTVWSTVKKLSLNDQKILIGSPIDNTCLYILDDNGGPCPIGLEGHLFIGGLGVAKGYIQDLEQTQNRFVKNPFRSNEIMYNTGDMARYESSGEVECLGRSDDQVKIRGFRIELGEIEEVALAQEAIHECAAKVHGNSIFIFLSLKPGIAYCEDTLKHSLKEKLPAYMIPQKIVVLDKLPKTLNGKIDKKALNEKQCVKFSPEKSESLSKQTNTMSEISEIWKNILEIENVEVDENFFNLGGHSISAVEIFGIVNDKYNLNLPLSVIFEAVTIRTLSDFIDTAIEKNKKELAQLKCAVAIKPGKKTLEPVFCFHGVGGNVLNYYRLGEHVGDRALFGVQSVGVNGEDQIVETIPAMAEIYIEEIKKIQPKGPYILSGGSMGGMVALEVAAQLQLQGEEIKSLIMFDTVGPDLDFQIYGNVKISFFTRVKNSVCLNCFKVIKYIKTQFYIMRKVSLPHSLRYFSIEDKNFVALRSYRPELYEGDMTLIRAPRTAKGWYADPYLGWRKVINGKIETIEIQGDHNNFIESPEMSEAFKKIIKKL